MFAIWVTLYVNFSWKCSETFVKNIRLLSFDIIICILQDINEVFLVSVDSFIFYVPFNSSRGVKFSFTTNNLTLYFSLVFGFTTGNEQEPTGATLVPFHMTSVCKHESSSSPSAYFRGKCLHLHHNRLKLHRLLPNQLSRIHSSASKSLYFYTLLISSNSSLLSILWAETLLHFLEKWFFSLHRLHLHTRHIFLSGWWL